MEFLNSIDLAQFGMAAPFMAYLLYQNYKQGKTIEMWQSKYTNILETQIQDYIKSTQTLESVMQVIRSGS